MSQSSTTTSSSSSSSSSSSTRRKLQALQYPNATTVDLTDVTAYRTLVVWLEFTKIRFYPPAQRGDLQDIARADWETVFTKYLDDLQCTRSYDTFTPETRSILIDWLLTQAIAAEYADHATQYNQVIHKPHETAGGEQTWNIDVTSPAFLTALHTLASSLSIPTHTTTTGTTSTPVPPLSLLRAVRKRVEERVAVSEMEQEIKKKASSSSQAVVDADPMTKLDQMDGGFSTQDLLLDRCAKLLRLSFIDDLRTLQTAINQCIVLVQEYTADPRTDTRLGKVGI